MRVCTFIRQFRRVKENAGLNNRELAKKIGVSEQTVGSLLLGNASSVSDATAEKIARWLALNGERLAEYPVSQSEENLTAAAGDSCRPPELTVERAVRFLAGQLGLDWHEVLTALLEAAKKEGRS